MTPVPGGRAERGSSYAVACPQGLLEHEAAQNVVHCAAGDSSVTAQQLLAKPMQLAPSQGMPGPWDFVADASPELTCLL